MKGLRFACIRQWWREQAKSTDLHRLGVSFWSCIAFIGLGVSLVVFAPTLLDIAHQLNVGVGLLSVIFFVRAIGGVIGTAGSGVLMDHFPRLQYAILCCVLVGGAAATAVVPVSVHIAILGVVMFFMGVSLGGLDNGHLLQSQPLSEACCWGWVGVHTILMRLWGDKSGPCMQFLHASFAFGAFIAPLIAKPFIQDVPDTEGDYNATLVSCNSGNLTDFPYCDDIEAVACVCADAVTEVCNGTSSAFITVSYENGSNCSVIVETEKEPLTLNYGWAYWISAMFLVVPLLAFFYFALRYNISSFLKNKSKEDDCLELSLETDGDSFLANRDSTGKSNPSSNTSTTTKTYKYPSLILLFCFMFAYVGSEVSYGSLLFTYAVEGELQFDKQTAATLTALFWGLFAFTRLFSVILALLKVRASVMMTMNVCGSVVAIFILLILPHNHIAIWIASALLGTSFASIYPTTMTWLSQHLPVSGKVTAIVVAGGNVGDIILPSGIAALVGSVNPDSFVYCTFALIILSAVLIALLFIVTVIYQKRQKPDVGSVRYHKLQSISTEDPDGGNELETVDVKINSTV